jgi:hypothetical protein
MHPEKILEILNSLTRHDLVVKDWRGEEMEEDPWGDWIRADDLAAAFGFVLDGPFDPARDTSRGFTKKPEEPTHVD